tara:strand:+ start:79 stop:507 length:429 start_codon:yes stop_codon:yes gene_type:complete
MVEYYQKQKTNYIMKLSQFDKSSVKEIRVAMDAALAKVEKQYGIKISTGNARFSDEEIVFKVKANAIDTSGNVKTKEAKAWETIRHAIGLGNLSVGDDVKVQDKFFALKGYNSRARKSPIEIEDYNGRAYKISVDTLKLFNK